MRNDWEVIIIGGGPAGLAAALSCAENGVAEEDILILERDHAAGGILQQCIHNGFGLHAFREELTGPEYAQRYIDRLERTKIALYTDTMALEVSDDRTVTAVNRERGVMLLRGKAVILAMGCRERTRGALNIPGTRPAGVFTAGCAQRLVNMEGYMPGKEVVILGSGDIGLIMARRMTWEGAKVRMVCELMPYSSGLSRNIVQCLEDNEIPLRFSHTVVDILGRERVEGVVVAEVDANLRPIPESFETVPCDTLLLSVGLLPENELTEMAGAEMDRRTRGAVVDENRQTSVPGIFACGNVLHVHDLVDNVSEEAAKAGGAAAAYIRGEVGHAAVITLKNGEGVSYTVPQRITDPEKALDIYYRTRAAYRPAILEVRAGDTLLLSRRKPIMTPGEMEKITLPAGKLAGISGEVTLSVKEV
ncbi:MAG: NAD(P)/FAD-dependent oxidoreductase [Christensenellales bacterium]|jgi:thioredoxin reductase